MADIVDEIRRLAEEAARESYDLPGPLSLAYNHPGVLSYQIKTQPHYQKDMQRASWLGKVNDMRRQYEYDGRGLEFRDAVNPKFMEMIDKRGDIASPYWNRGAMAFGQPLREGLNWASSVPATVFNAGRMVAGVEGADEDFLDSADLASGRMLGIAAGRENPSQQAWEAERAAEDARPMADLSPLRESHGSARVLPTIESALKYEPLASRGQTSGQNVLEEMGAPEGWGRQLGGAMLEASVDPVSGVRTGIRALLGRNMPLAAAELGSEMALPGMLIAAQEGLKRQAEQWARDRSVSRR